MWIFTYSLLWHLISYKNCFQLGDFIAMLFLKDFLIKKIRFVRRFKLATFKYFYVSSKHNMLFSSKLLFSSKHNMNCFTLIRSDHNLFSFSVDNHSVHNKNCWFDRKQVPTLLKQQVTLTIASCREVIFYYRKHWNKKRLNKIMTVIRTIMNWNEIPLMRVESNLHVQFILEI